MLYCCYKTEELNFDVIFPLMVISGAYVCSFGDWT